MLLAFAVLEGLIIIALVLRKPDVPGELQQLREEYGSKIDAAQAWTARHFDCVWDGVADKDHRDSPNMQVARAMSRAAIVRAMEIIE